MVGFAVKESMMQKNSPKKIFQRIQSFMIELEFHSRIDFAKKQTQCAIGSKCGKDRTIAVCKHLL